MDIKTQSLIQNGKFSKIYMAISSTYGKIVMKEFQRAGMSEEVSMLINKETSVMSQLQSPYIVKYMGKIEGRSTILLLYEYCEFNGLDAKIKHNRMDGTFFSEFDVINVAFGVLNGLEYLHQLGIVHRDIEPEHILLTLIKQEIVPKIADFSYSHQCTTLNEGIVAFIGKPIYMAPEILKGECYNFAVDIWSLGCSLIELCNLRHPFQYDTIELVRRHILTEDVPKISDRYSSDLADLISLMLTKRPLLRPSATKLLKHRIFSECKPIQLSMASSNGKLHAMNSVQEDRSTFSELTDSRSAQSLREKSKSHSSRSHKMRSELNSKIQVRNIPEGFDVKVNAYRNRSQGATPKKSNERNKSHSALKQRPKQPCSDDEEENEAEDDDEGKIIPPSANNIAPNNNINNSIGGKMTNLPPPKHNIKYPLYELPSNGRLVNSSNRASSFNPIRNTIHKIPVPGQPYNIRKLINNKYVNSYPIDTVIYDNSSSITPHSDDEDDGININYNTNINNNNNNRIKGSSNTPGNIIPSLDNKKKKITKNKSSKSRSKNEPRKLSHFNRGKKYTLDDDDDNKIGVSSSECIYQSTPRSTKQRSNLKGSHK